MIEDRPGLRWIFLQTGFPYLVTDILRQYKNNLFGCFLLFFFNMFDGICIRVTPYLPHTQGYFRATAGQIKNVKWRNWKWPWHRINNQPEVRLRVGAFDVSVLAHVDSRISSWPSIRHVASSTGSFYRRVCLHIGPYKYKWSGKRQPS